MAMFHDVSNILAKSQWKIVKQPPIIFVHLKDFQAEDCSYFGSWLWQCTPGWGAGHPGPVGWDGMESYGILGLGNATCFVWSFCETICVYITYVCIHVCVKPYLSYQKHTFIHVTRIAHCMLHALLHLLLLLLSLLACSFRWLVHIKLDAWVSHAVMYGLGRFPSLPCNWVWREKGYHLQNLGRKSLRRINPPWN